MPHNVDSVLNALLGMEEPLSLPALSDGEWLLLTRKAQAEGVAPLAYWNLSTWKKISALPKEVRGALRQSYSQAWMQNQALFHELELLTREFHRAEIPVVALKGACFALTLYPDIGARPMGDLDLLVPATQQRQAVQIAKDLGYEESLPEASRGLSELLNHEIFLQKKGAPAVILELHRSLVADRSFKYAVPAAWFWTQTQPLKDPRFPNLLVLSPAAQLLYASAHAMLQHGGKNAPLRWFVDIDRIIRVTGEALNWKLLLAQAEEFGWGSAVNAALKKTREFLETPIPPDVDEALSNLKDNNARLVERLNQKPLTHTQGEFQKLATLNFYGKLRLIHALVFPSPAYMRWRYGIKTSGQMMLYYPLRWVGILTDGIRTLFAWMSPPR